MKTVLVTYYSRSGHTRKMAELIAEALTGRGVKADLIPVEEVQIDTLPGYDGFFVGSPNYFGTMAWPIKKFIDEGIIGGGGDAVLLDILKTFLIHGCVVQGLTGIGHFGPVAIGAPDERIEKEVKILVERFSALLEKL